MVLFSALHSLSQNILKIRGIRDSLQCRASFWYQSRVDLYETRRFVGASQVRVTYELAENSKSKRKQFKRAITVSLESDNRRYTFTQCFSTALVLERRSSVVDTIFNKFGSGLKNVWLRVNQHFFSSTSARKSMFKNLNPPAANRFAILEYCDGSILPSRVAGDTLFLGFFISFIFSVKTVTKIKSFLSLTRTKQLVTCECVLISTSACSFSRTVPPI